MKAVSSRSQTPSSPTTLELVKELSHEASDLLTQHIELFKVETTTFVKENVEKAKIEIRNAKEELSENISKGVKTAEFVWVGAHVLMMAFAFLLVGVALFVNEIAMQYSNTGSVAWVGPVASGLIAAVVGTFLSRRGTKVIEKAKRDSL